MSSAPVILPDLCPVEVVETKLDTETKSKVETRVETKVETEVETIDQVDHVDQVDDLDYEVYQVDHEKKKEFGHSKFISTNQDIDEGDCLLQLNQCPNDLPHTLKYHPLFYCMLLHLSN